MLWSKTMIPTLKEVPQEAETISHQLMLRAGLVRMLMAGVYSYLPLGLKVLNNIENIIRQEMDSCAGAQVLLPALQPLELWQKTGRDKDIGQVMFRFVDRRGRKVCLGPTHEEIITELARGHIFSYKQLPLLLYQIQTKFRDEIRPRFGLIRSCEFIMKDAYSFDKDEAGLDKNYKAMYEAYLRIFKRCGLQVLITEADSGVMGGKVSHEFMVPAKDGEDAVSLCPQCKTAATFKEEAGLNCPKCKAEISKVNCIEIGHIFKLGTKYSAALGANFLSAQGKQEPLIMGCYGIGVSRLIPAIIEQNNDPDGIIWPKEITPYEVLVIALDTTKPKIMELAEDIYRKLNDLGLKVLFDDRDERAGVKFKDADLLGIPLQVIIGKGALEGNTIELKLRKTKEKIIGAQEEVYKKIKEIIIPTP
ncbi:MAG: proline--tRNA ligase [Candidatus Omnitrophica bacterium]|nr:proline--tRNA ligase [Candidatus Omnitrophota bacterium]